MFAKTRTGVFQSLRHLAKNMHAAILGLPQGNLHDLFGDASDLDVHLKRRHTSAGSSHLEVHVAQMILVTENIREHRKAFIFLDETHGDTRHRCFQGNTRIHERERCATHRCHRR